MTPYAIETQKTLQIRSAISIELKTTIAILFDLMFGCYWKNESARETVSWCSSVTKSQSHYEFSSATSMTKWSGFGSHFEM